MLYCDNLEADRVLKQVGRMDIGRKLVQRLAESSFHFHVVVGPANMFYTNNNADYPREFSRLVPRSKTEYCHLIMISGRSWKTAFEYLCIPTPHVHQNATFNLVTLEHSFPPEVGLVHEMGHGIQLLELGDPSRFNDLYDKFYTDIELNNIIRHEWPACKISGNPKRRVYYWMKNTSVKPEFRYLGMLKPRKDRKVRSELMRPMDLDVTTISKEQIRFDDRHFAKWHELHGKLEEWDSWARDHPPRLPQQSTIPDAAPVPMPVPPPDSDARERRTGAGSNAANRRSDAGDVSY